MYKKVNLRQARKEWVNGVKVYCWPVYGQNADPFGMEISIFTSKAKDKSFDDFVTMYKKLSRQKMLFFVTE